MIEILSPGSGNRTRDFNLKRKLYEKYGVPEYWVLDTWARSITIFQLKDHRLAEVTTLRANDDLESPIFPGLSLKLSDIFVVVDE